MKTLTAVVVLFAASMASAQTTWNVPGDSATIQGAIDLALAGDTVLVASGTYNEALTISKEITVESVSGSAATSVDVQGGGRPVVFADVGNAAVLRGFTLTGGAATSGAGVLLNAASPRIEACRITQNAAVTDGGGILAVGFTPSEPSSPIFSRCLIDGNQAAGNGGGFAGESHTVPRFEDCTFRGNVAGGNGGGFFATSSLVGAVVDLELVGCLFEDNVASAGGGVYYTKPSGAGTRILSDCTFIGNQALAGGGGGVYGWVNWAKSPFGGDIIPGIFDLTDCRLIANHAAEHGGGAAAGGTVRRCVLVGNTAGDIGGALAGPFGTFFIDVSRCTLLDNSAGTGAGAASRALSVDSCIVRGNQPDAFGTWSPTIDWSNVEGGAPGIGNIDLDPLFVDTSAEGFCLSSASPCIDTGNEGLIDPDGSRLDMGAIPRSTFCDTGRALGSTHGIPTLAGDGPLTPGSTTTISLTDGWPSGFAGLVIGVSPLMFPFESGIMVPSLDWLVLGLPLDVDGGIAFGGAWPAGVPADFTVYLQMWMEDPTGFSGWSATNGLLGNTD